MELLLPWNASGTSPPSPAAFCSISQKRDYADDDGLYEYAQQSEKGLLQQGWKDSSDAIFHSDGRIAEAPIALCEMQGYVYATKQAIAALCPFLRRDALRVRLLGEAEHFNRASIRLFGILP